MLMCALLMAVAIVAPSSAMAQTGGTRQIVNGQTVAWSSEWTFIPDVSIVDTNLELVALSSGTSVVGYGATTFPVPGNQLRDILLEGFTEGGTLQQIDRGDYDNVSYSIDISESEGIALAIFTLVIEGESGSTIGILIDSPEAFEPGMESAQAGITIDGSQIFDGVDAAAMQRVITAAVGGTTSSQPPTTPPTTPVPSPTSVTTSPMDRSSRIGGSTTPTPEGQGQPAAQLPGSHIIPTSGTDVRFGTDWQVGESGDSQVQLTAPGVPAFLSVLVLPDDLPAVGEPQGFAQALLDTPEFASSTLIDAVTADNGGRWIIAMQEPGQQGNLITVYEIRSAPAGSTVVSMTAAEDQLPAALQLANAGVQVDGQPVLADATTHVPALAGFGG